MRRTPHHSYTMASFWPVMFENLYLMCYLTMDLHLVATRQYPYTEPTDNRHEIDIAAPTC